NLVEGNYIGTDVNGTTAIPNAIGVDLAAADGAVVGAPGAGRNVISGNSRAGVLIDQAVPNATTLVGNQVAGNLSGLGPSGNPLGNRGGGVQVRNGASAAMIGPGNVISANGATSLTDGVQITNPATHGIVVKGNYIGTDLNGATTSATLSNWRDSIRID